MTILKCYDFSRFSMIVRTLLTIKSFIRSRKGTSPSPLPSLDEVVFQDVEAAHHLGEDEHPVASGLHLGQQLVDEDQLPG